jgi:hypothetical protein
MSRADTPFDQRPDFYLYVNDFDAFATASFEEILSESRKYHLNLTCCCDNLNLLPANVRSTIFGNVGSLFAFRSSVDDADRVANELQPVITAADLTNLPPKEFYVKMSVRTKAQEVFSGEVLPVEYPEVSVQKECVERSRATYCLPREQARSMIQAWGQVG